MLHFILRLEEPGRGLRAGLGRAWQGRALTAPVAAAAHAETQGVRWDLESERRRRLGGGLSFEGRAGLMAGVSFEDTQHEGTGKGCGVGPIVEVVA